MESVTVHAIVLRRRDAGESDRRLTVLTREQGKIDVVAKGARKAGSRLAGSSEPLMASVLQIAPSKRSAFVTQAQPIASFKGLRTSYDRLAYGLALLELNEAILPWHEPLPEAYELLMLSLRDLEGHSRAEIAFVWAQLALLRLSGFLPQFSECVSTGNPLKDAAPVLSPTSGGYVSQGRSEFLFDGFQVRAEVAIGLARTAELDSPPPNLKFAEECLLALVPFWRHIADRPLPSLESCANDLRAQAGSTA